MGEERRCIIELKNGMRLRVIKPFRIEKPEVETAYATTNAEGIVRKTQFLPVYTLKFYAPERLKGIIYPFKYNENLSEHFEIITKKYAKIKSHIA